MSRKKVRLLAGAVGVFVMLMGGLMTATPATAAASCYGDYCSGQDPMAADVGGVPCADGAKTVAVSRVKVVYTHPGSDPYQTTDDVGFVELRWSPRCQTNWARFTAERSSYVTEVWATQDTGYRQTKRTMGLYGNTEPGTFWTPMIYSPVHHVAAQVVCIGAVLSGSCGWLNQTAWV